MPSFIGFYPTPEKYVDVFFELSPVSSSDAVYDLGSGDGRLIFAAVERGAGRAVGIELDPELVRNSRKEAENRHLSDRMTFLEADVVDVELSPATVVFCYLSTAAAWASSAN